MRPASILRSSPRGVSISVGAVGGLESWGKHICCAAADVQGAVRKRDETSMRFFSGATSLSAAKAATMAQFFYVFNELDRKPQVLDELTSQSFRSLYILWKNPTKFGAKSSVQKSP